MDKRETLKSVFGHDGFREGQERLIDELLGGYDVLGVMPTGAGKSICYQLPALLLPGITLVVSPLISLMKDQVMALKAAGVPAAYINSSLTPAQQTEALRRAANGAYKIIYVAPERLDTPQFMAFTQQARLSLLAVDEAHCVSQWGQDFRPSYLRIAEFVAKLPKRPPVGAFTATATRQVREDIIRLLGLVEPYCAVTGYNRPNLRFTSVKPSNKYVMLLDFLQGVAGECGIIYCNTRKLVEEVTSKLLLDGYSATRYHAGLSDEERRRNQDDFQYDRAKIMVATNAFGMGIDKSNVRYVVHYNMPRNLESYYQEAGRAGRDGEPAECLLMYSGQDVMTGRWMIEHSEDNPELTQAQRAEVMKRDLERLRQMTFYATSKRCLRQFILRYFGETDAPDECGSCSVCEGMPFEVDTGSSRPLRAGERRAVSRLEKRGRGEEGEFSAWERALLENLKTLRMLLASQKHVPAYVIFTDAALRDMVRRRPASMEAFLKVSGVGEAKCAQYGEAFLAVIRDGREPNEAAAYYGERTERAKRVEPAERRPEGADRMEKLANAGMRWTEEEEARLREEYLGGMRIAEIARRHRRNPGGILSRLKHMGMVE